MHPKHVVALLMTALHLNFDLFGLRVQHVDISMRLTVYATVQGGREKSNQRSNN